MMPLTGPASSALGARGQRAAAALLGPTGAGHASSSTGTGVPAATAAAAATEGRVAHHVGRVALAALAGTGAMQALRPGRPLGCRTVARGSRAAGPPAATDTTVRSPKLELGTQPTVDGLAQQRAAGAGQPPAPDADDIVQFDSAVYFVEEEEMVMKVDVLRMGSMLGECSVDYTTEDGSAVAGDRYEHVQGTLVFQPGEVFKTLEIPLIDNEKWETTLEFKIRLSNPQHCELGRYLYLSRVKVIDGDFFPTSRYAKEFEEYGCDETGLRAAGVSGIDLLIEYCKLNFSRPGVGLQSLGVLVIGQLQALYFLLTTYVVQYCADNVLASTGSSADYLIPGERDATLLLLAAIYLIPFGLLNVLDIWKAQQKIAETSRAWLQQSIFRKFLNYDEASRNAVTSSELGLTIIQDAQDIVNSGYMNVFELAKQFGKLLVSCYFIYAENPDALIPTFFIGLCLAAYIFLNYSKVVAAREEVSDRQARVVDVAQEGSSKIQLIADYRIRPVMEETLQRRIAELNEATIPLSMSQITNEYFPNWLSNLLVAGYLAFGGEAVINGSIQIGTFLATVSIFKGIGDSFRDIFSASLELSAATGPLQKVTGLLNLQTNLRKQKAINRRRRAVTKLERDPSKLKALREASGMRYGTDAIPIQIKDLSFCYPGNSRPEVQDVSLSVPQGKLVAVCGPRRGGKSTFIKLLGQVQDPTAGEIFIPSYLRILHVSASPIILDGSIWRNLTVGARNYWRDEEFESLRAMRICKRLGFSSRFLKLLEETRETFLKNTEIEGDSSWSRQLSLSDRMLVHVARAFVYNPEILVMNRPTGQLPESVANEVFSLLREFVDNRGIELPSDSSEKRRPRTAFISYARATGALSSDVIWVVEEGRVREAAKEEVSSIFVG